MASEQRVPSERAQASVMSSVPKAWTREASTHTLRNSGLHLVGQPVSVVARKWVQYTCSSPPAVIDELLVRIVGSGPYLSWPIYKHLSGDYRA